jgi:histidinol-phosphate aminotransferase
MRKSESLLARANPWVNDLVSYVPGKPIEDVARELGIAPEKIVKLASNENPLGPSEKALNAIEITAKRLNFYPDGGGFHLRSAIAKKFGLDLENVVLGNGSNEIIEFLGHAFLQPGDEVLTAQYAFAIYGIMAQLFGAKTIAVPDRNFTCDLVALAKAITPKTKIIYLANPNNPTATMVSEQELDQFIEKLRPDIAFALDEAYYEFLDEPPNTLKYVQERANVVLLRTFSKIQGLAGLRIGYGLANSSLADLLRKTRQPFNTNSLALAAAQACLEDSGHEKRTKSIVRQGREFLQQEFTNRQIEFVPSSANFILVRVGNGKSIFQKLLRRGMIVRAMDEYRLPQWIRVSVGTPEQNRRFLEDFDAVRETPD